MSSQRAPVIPRRRLARGPDLHIDADCLTTVPRSLRIITGRDGKTYQRPVMPPGRVIAATAPLPLSDNDFARVLINLKAAERELTRLITDPRFSADRFARHGPAIISAADSIAPLARSVVGWLGPVQEGAGGDDLAAP